MEQKKSSPNISIFNLSKSLRSPIADSTRIVRSPSNNSTGITRITQKRKPTSPLSSRNAMSKTSLGTICYNRTIDSQTYTDATSDGIASRLVKYGGFTEEPRSMSSALRSSFIRTSPFPVLKLKKSEMKSMPKRSISLSHVRIAPPEKVIFQANCRSNILRSGSLTALNNVQRNDNEPLNPSSASEVGVSPAKSSLDALKEISRKRINNEELDAERIKKHCKEISEVDNSTNGITTVTDIIYRNANVSKRPREAGTSPSGSQNGEVEKQKKRLCTKSNEVMSSYSSSISLTTPRRQLKDMHIRKGLDLDKAPPPDTPANISQAQAMRPTVLQQMNIPTIPRREVQQVPAVPVRKASSAPKITLFNKKYDQVPIETANPYNIEGDEDVNKINFVKPKQANPLIKNGTEALRNAEKSKLALLLQCLAGDSDDETEDMVDSKLKEKSDQSTVNPLETKVETKQPDAANTIKPIANTTLSLEKSETDQVKSVSTTADIIQLIPIKPIFSFGASSSTSAASSTTNTVTTVTSVPSFTFGVISTPASTNTSSTTPTTSNSISVAKTLEPTSVISFNTITSTPTLTPSVIVSSQALVSSSLSAFASTNTASIPKFIFGANSVSQPAASKTEQNSTINPVSSEPTFAFGPSTVSDKPATSTTQKPTLPIFGNTTGLTNITTAPTTVVSATTTSPITSSTTIGSSIFGAFSNQQNPSKDSATFGQANAPTFNFGNTTNTQTSTSVNASAITTGPEFSFGTGNNSNTSIPTTKPPPFNASSSFNFGANSQTNVFNQSTATTTTQPQSTPSFGSTTATTQPQQAPIFGQTTATSQSQQAPIFGQSTANMNSTQPSSNIFGQANTNQSQSNLFGQTGNSNQPMNVFGQTGVSALNQSQTNVFGQTNASTPANQPPSNVFGQTGSTQGANHLPSSIFGQSMSTQNTNQTGGFNFKTPSPPVPSQQNSAGGFPFNANTRTSNQSDQKPSVFSRLGPNPTPTNPIATVSPSKSLFTFSQNSSTQNTGTAGNPNTTSNIFGGSMNTNNNNNNNNSSSIFGTSGNTSTFAQNQEQNKNLFNFGSNQNPTANNSPFGFSSGSQASQTTATPQSSQESKPFVFGQNTGSSTGSAFAFNSNNNTNMSNNNNNPTSPGSGAFAFGQATPQQNSKPFSFASGASSPPPPPIFGSQPTHETPKFQFNSGSSGTLFGANNNNNNNNNIAPSFGTPATPAGPVFNFSAGNNNNPGFGSGSSTGSSSGPFNFTSPAALTQTPSGLAFNIGTSGTPQTQRRPIRQATRRLK